MLKDIQATLKSRGRNMMKVLNQRSASEPMLDENKGESTGSSRSGRGYKKRAIGVYRSPK